MLFIHLRNVHWIFSNASYDVNIENRIAEKNKEIRMQRKEEAEEKAGES